MATKGIELNARKELISTFVEFKGEWGGGVFLPRPILNWFKRDCKKSKAELLQIFSSLNID